MESEEDRGTVEDGVRNVNDKGDGTDKVQVCRRPGRRSRGRVTLKTVEEVCQRDRWENSIIGPGS